MYTAVADKAFAAVESYRSQVDYPGAELPADAVCVLDLDRLNAESLRRLTAPLPPAGR
jgi:hypothetical protein